MNARRALGLCFLCWGLVTWCAGAHEKTGRFHGEVAQGLTFRRSMGHGLYFVLKPTSEGGSINGWILQVSPQGQSPTSECRDLAWVVTPPFRYQNMLYLDTSYGTTAQEAVQISPRDFNFVLSCDDYRTEYERVKRVLWPANFPKEEVDDALADLGTIRHGTGRLWIRDSKYTPGDKSANPAQYGEIHWIKFEVEISFPEDRLSEPRY